MSKKKVAVLMGGRSTEHEISIISAKNIIQSTPADKYDVLPIVVDKEGTWWLIQSPVADIDTSNPKDIPLPKDRVAILFSQDARDGGIYAKDSGEKLSDVDVIFPVLHGAYGEDGAIQGLAKIANLPCVGPGILGSAVGMDKEVMKRLLRDAGIANAKFITLRPYNRNEYDYDRVSAELGEQLFVKPVNLGSSVGVSHVKSAEDYERAIELAFQYDNKVIIEERIYGREIECAVLGNDDPKASAIGEIIPHDGFYDFESKYVDADGAGLAIPADLTDEQVKRVQELSIATYRCLECSGMARVDMFLTPDDRLIINEINTIPGFTSISMYPSLWRYSGLADHDLIDRLIELAIEEHEQSSRLLLSA